MGHLQDIHLLEPAGVEQDLLRFSLGIAGEQHRVRTVVQQQYERVVVRV